MSTSLDKLCEKKKLICQGCKQEYESNVNHVLCEVCDDIKREVFCRIMMEHTWEKFEVSITYKIDYTNHSMICKNSNKITNKEILTTFKFELLKEINSHNISESGRIIIDDYVIKYLGKYCKDFDTVCKCGQKRICTIVSAIIEKVTFVYKN